MKVNSRKMLQVLVLLLLCLFFPAVSCAEKETTPQAGESVIAAFEPLGDAGEITVEYKLALVTLQKLFPEQLAIRLEGNGSCQYVQVTWKCAENYDEVYDSYHFEPVPEGIPVAEGIELPVITVHVLGESAIPSLEAIEDNSESEVVVFAQKLRGANSLPSSYNSYESGRLPAIRSQAPYGSCWLFSAVGTLEADLISMGESTDIDLSELHLGYYAYHSYYDEKGCGYGDQYGYSDPDYMNAGGLQSRAIRVLSNMVGPAPEETIPYAWGNDYQPNPLDGRAYGNVQLDKAYKINAADQAGIKAAIREHGAVSASIFWDDKCYSYTHNSLYCSKKHFTNHAIMLVGWDDSFSRENFSETAPFDGAWLVRNSWGLDAYGREGYFWMSYADKSYLGDDVYVYDALDGHFDHCYSYATVPGSLNAYSFNDSVTAVQHFMVDGGEKIVAVGFETMSPGLSIRAELTLGEQTVSSQTDADYPGYYTLDFSGDPLVAARRSEVTLTMYYEGESIRIPTEYAGTFEDSVETSTGVCGSGGLILNGSNTGEDGLLKLFTVDCDVPGEEGLRINAETFPDNAFRNYISSSFDTDHNGFLSDGEIAAVTVMDFIPANRARSGNDETFKTPGPVKNLRGLEHFTELRTLYCAGNRLTAIDISQNSKLEALYCDDNQITNLDLSRNVYLKELSCTDNPLTALDISYCPELVDLIASTLPELNKYAVVFSHEGRYLAFEIGVSLNPAFDLGNGLVIDETSFPDDVFRSYVAAYCDMDGNGMLTDHELTAVKYINCSGSEDNPDEKIQTLEGIGHFPYLEKLKCGTNLLAALDLSGNPALTELVCPDNRLEQLDLHINTPLQKLDCHKNPALTGLNLSGCTEIRELDCSEAGLESLELGECSQLENLNCSDNLSLQMLDISGSLNLQTLSCGKTQIPELDVHGYTMITRLECSSNSRLTSVNVAGCIALEWLSCNDCSQLTTLNIRGCEELDTLQCKNGSLSQLNLNNCNWLSNITCYGNRIAAIDILSCYILSGITEYYTPVFDEGIASYNYEGHKIAFDESTILINIEPDFILPDNLKTVAEEAFAGCTFWHVVLSGQTDFIGERAFADCPDLLCIQIPNANVWIDSQAFGNRTGLVIFGRSGGTAETFARDHSCFFIPME